MFKMEWKMKGGANSWGNTLSHRLKFWEYQAMMYGAIEQALESMLDEITQWMRSNASWQDRTGRARAALAAQMDEHRSDVQYGSYKRLSIVLGYMNNADPVFYAWYLETKNAGKYAILTPALDMWAGRVFDKVKQQTGL